MPIIILIFVCFFGAMAVELLFEKINKKIK